MKDNTITTQYIVTPDGVNVSDPKCTKANVLGETYIIIEDNELNDSRLATCDGYCDSSTKKIVIRDDLNTRIDLMDAGNLDYCRRQVLRHELIHAFLSESGLQVYSQDEVLVDWIASQAEKMFSLFVDNELLTYRKGESC